MTHVAAEVQAQKTKRRRGGIRGGVRIDHRDEADVLGRPGSDLLFQALRLSTIGAEDFDGRVRDGIGYRLLAMTTRPAKDGTGIGDQRSVIRRDYCPRSPILKQADFASLRFGISSLITDH